MGGGLVEGWCQIALGGSLFDFSVFHSVFFLSSVSESFHVLFIETFGVPEGVSFGLRKIFCVKNGTPRFCTPL